MFRIWQNGEKRCCAPILWFFEKACVIYTKLLPGCHVIWKGLDSSSTWTEQRTWSSAVKAFALLSRRFNYVNSFKYLGVILPANKQTFVDCGELWSRLWKYVRPNDFLAHGAGLVQNKVAQSLHTKSRLSRNIYHRNSSKDLIESNFRF